MSRDTSYQAVMARKNEIMKMSMGLDYDVYKTGELAFDYEKMMDDCGFTLEDVVRIQAETKVGNTPLYELKNLTNAVRKTCKPGKGARIFVKDEAANASPLER